MYNMWTVGIGPAVGDDLECGVCERRTPEAFTLEDKLVDGGPTGLCTRYLRGELREGGGKVEV